MCHVEEREHAEYKERACKGWGAVECGWGPALAGPVLTYIISK